MGKYLTLVLVKLFFISISITMISTFILLSQLPENHHACDMSGLAYGVGIMMILALTLSSSTVFFNLNRHVSNSASFSLLSFFLLPAAISILLSNELGIKGEAPELYCVIVLPFMLLLAFYYIQFRKRRLLI